MRLILWRLLIWLWARRARKLYGWPVAQGELFNTACFQAAIRQTTSADIHGATVAMWLQEFGYVAGHGGCHWYRSTDHLNKSMLH